MALQLHVKKPMLVGTPLVLTFSLVPLAVWKICAAAVVAGIGRQIFGVPWYATLQRVIPSHRLSRVSAYDHLGSVALAPLGIVAGGVLFEVIGGRYTLLSLYIVIGRELYHLINDICAYGARGKNADDRCRKNR